MIGRRAALTVAAAALARSAAAQEPGATQPEGFPMPKCNFALEMAFMQDFSASFEADKEVTALQLEAVLTAVDGWYEDSRVGMATFVDKPLLNFGYPAMGDWFDGDWCLNVTHPLDHGLDVETMVQQFYSSPDGGGNDWAENQLGAMLDVAKGPLMKWTVGDTTDEGKPVLRLMVVATDSMYHIAGEGFNSTHQLPPNDGDGVTLCTGEDYPSISQVGSALADKNVYTVFLVGNNTDENIFSVYEELLVSLGVPGGVYPVTDDTNGLVEAFQMMFEDMERTYCRKTVDVVFAQDVTYSYRGEMPNFQGKMGSLLAQLDDDTEDSRYGFTTFGDKPINPFGHAGSGDYCFRVESALTADRQAVIDAADAVTTTSGLDWRESQLDGLISAVKHASIEYREGDYVEGLALIRIVVLATDSGYHREGDGPDNGHPELVAHDGLAIDDAKCTTQEYPSVALLAAALLDADVQPVFVPTSWSPVLNGYNDLANQLADYGVESVVIQLEDFGGDVVASLAAGIGELISKVQIRRAVERVRALHAAA